MTTLEDRTTSVEERFDRISDQLGFIVAELERQARRRDSIEEAVHDFMPLATQGMASVAADLDGRDIDLAEVKGLLLKVAGSAGRLEALLGRLESLSELAGDASSLGTEAMAAVTSRLADLDRKGYFAFSRQAFDIVDRVVENYTEDDVAALGENVVLILDTVKEMTQPDVMGLLRNTASALHEQADEVAEGHEETPSMLGLLRQMRQPEVRLGLQRAIGMLRSISAPAEAPTNDSEEGVN